MYRDAPNSLIYASPHHLEPVFGRKSRLTKSKLYWILTPDTLDTEFSTFLARDHEVHARLRKGVAGAYSVSSVMKYEAGMDAVFVEWLERLEELGTVEFGAWASYLAMDVSKCPSAHAPRQSPMAHG